MLDGMLTVDRSFIELPIDLSDYRLPYPMYKIHWDTGACWFRLSAKTPHIKQLMYTAIQGGRMP
jgi:hypothetical protein